MKSCLSSPTSGILWKALCTIALCLSARPEARAQLPHNRGGNDHWTFAFQLENDLFANTDANYTNGVRFSWTSPDLVNYRDAGGLPQWLLEISDHLPFIQADGVRNIVVSLGQNMYTPDDITVANPDPLDRPYAGWLYFGVAFHNKTATWMDVIEVNFGVVGPASFAEESQRTVHKIINSPLPQGWDHQIGNEVALNIVWERSRRIGRIGDAVGLAGDAFIHFGSSLGTLYTYANAGFTIRSGWNLPSDFGSAPIRLAGDVNAPAAMDDPRLREHNRWGIAGFITFDGRAVARDGTLDGNLFSDSPEVDKKPFVADFGAGVSLTAGPWKLSYAQVVRSREFESQKRDYHVYGSISIALTY